MAKPLSKKGLVFWFTGRFSGRFDHGFDAAGADSDFFAVNDFWLQVQFLASDGLLIGVADSIALEGSALADVTIWHNL